MKKMISILLLLTALPAIASCGSSNNSNAQTPDIQAETRIVKGDDGTEVEIPATVDKAAPLIGAFAQMTEMLTAGGGKIVAAATNNVSDYFKQVFPDYTESNPNNYNSSALEDLIASGAQVCYGPASIFDDEQLVQLKAANIAFVPINNIGTVEGMSNAFLIIGEILGDMEYERAKEFVEYYNGNINRSSQLTAGVADKATFLSLFYSADAFTTINGNDICNSYIEAAGGINVAKDYTPQAGSNSLTVDAEQIVAWNPKFIVTGSQAGRDAILADPALATVEAIANGDVYVYPFGVYLWSVRSGEGSMLPLWLGTKMYPELFSEYNMETVVQDFFSYWYNYDISPEEIQNTLNGQAS